MFSDVFSWSGDGLIDAIRYAEKSPVGCLTGPWGMADSVFAIGRLFPTSPTGPSRLQGSALLLVRTLNAVPVRCAKSNRPTDPVPVYRSGD